MEANELRIGNIVIVPKIVEKFNSGENCLIQGLGEVEITIKNFCSIFQQHQDLEPIPLTKEWLLKFGFNKTGNKYHLRELEEMPFIIHNENGLFYYNDSYPEIQVKYVHKLQNICYELTSEELTIKETA